MSEQPSEKVLDLRNKLEVARSRVSEINAEYAGQYLDPESDHGVEWNSRNEEIESLEKTIVQCEAREKRVRELADEPGAVEPGFQVRKERVRGDEIYDLTNLRTMASSPEDELRLIKDRALEAIERGSYPSSKLSKESSQEHAEELVRNVDKDAVLARRIVETGSPTYMRAFGKALEGRPLTDLEARALSTTDGAGGYNIPFTLDPTIIHTGSLSVNPYRGISRVVQVVTDNWHGIATQGASASYGEEVAEVAEASLEFTQPEAHPERATFFTPFSLELGQDWPSLQTEITSLVGDAKDNLEAVKFTKGAGSGSHEPEGILTGGTISVNTAATATFAVGDLYKVEGEMPDRYRDNASWVAKRNFYNAVRQFDTSGGAQLWTENLQRGLATQAPSPGNTGYNLLGFSANQCSQVPYATTTGGTIAVIGDFSKFLIVDRIGMSVEIVPHLFGASRKPTGQRGFLAVWRNTSKVLDPNAFRVLKAL